MKKALRIILLVVFIGIFVYSGWNLATYYLAAHQQEQTVSGLRKQLVEEEDSYELNADGILKRYEKLYTENPDMIGWLSVKDTPIDYPVMQRKGDGEYYLHRDFYEKDASAGCLFLEEHCDADKPSTNLIIYGHHMKDGSMFGSLISYKDAAFRAAHPIVQFDTLYASHSYEVVAAIETEIPAEGSDAFRYYDCVGTDAQQFAQYCAFIEENRCYDTGTTIQPGDRLLTLSTCAYHTANGRFLVVARQID